MVSLSKQGPGKNINLMSLYTVEALKFVPLTFTLPYSC